MLISLLRTPTVPEMSRKMQNVKIWVVWSLKVNGINITMIHCMFYSPFIENICNCTFFEI